jgi:hypothetical protein
MIIPARVEELLERDTRSPMTAQLVSEHEQRRAKLSFRLHIAVFGYFVFATTLAIVSWRGLVADGVGFFLHLLVHPSPTTWWRSRIFADTLQQCPLVLALRVGVTNIDVLLYVHSFGIYYLGPLQLLFCYWIVPREKRTDLVWPLLSLFAGSMNAWFVAVTESHVMTFIFWPLVLFMLHGRVDQRIGLIVFLGLACASLLAYETMALQGLVLAGFAFWRSRRPSDSGERNLWRVIAGSFLLGAGVAIYSILNPHDTISRDGLVRDIFRFAGTQVSDLNYPAILSFAALVLIALVFFGRALGAKTFRGLIVFFAVAAVFVAFAPVLMPDSLRPIQQFQARAWIGFLPAALAIAMTGVRTRNARLSPVVFERALIVISVLAFSQTTWQILATAQWRGYIQVVRSELSKHKGFIPYDRSPLSRQPDGIQVIRNLGWGWTYPSMSIALAPGGQVSTIFGARPGPWQPFDPQNPQELPKLSKYGIDYSAYLRAITSQ